MSTYEPKSRRKERGVVIIWTAFFMVLMLGFIAIGIDVAKVMATRSELQNAADAAALAGASAINLQTGKVRPDSALVRATQTAGLNKAFTSSPTAVALLAADVLVNPNANTVKVTVRRNAASGGPMITHVAQVLGFTHVDLSATATAQASPTCEQCEKLLPLGAAPPNGGQGFQLGTIYVLQASPPNQVSPGNYQSVDFPACNEGPCAGMSPTGANTYRCLLANGYACCASVGQVIQTEPGNMAGPTRQGLQSRWDGDTDRRTNIPYSQYTGNGDRVVNVPIVNMFPNGRGSVTIVGFAAFFLTARPAGNNAVTGEYIRDVVPGTSGNCNSTVLSLRLIQ